MNLPPCIRNGQRGVDDPRVRHALTMLRAELGDSVIDDLESLTDFDDQLWATWRGPSERDRGAPALTSAWARAGGTRGALHLLRIEQDYDYQDDCMNDAS